MYDWLRQALIDARSDPAEMRLIMRHQHILDRVRRLNLRDRWGYPLQDFKLAAIIEYVLDNSDHGALRRYEVAVVMEAVDRLAAEMMVGSLPMFCDGHDEPPSDETIQTVVRTILNLKEPSA